MLWQYGFIAFGLHGLAEAGKAHGVVRRQPKSIPVAGFLNTTVSTSEIASETLTTESSVVLPTEEATLSLNATSIASTITTVLTPLPSVNETVSASLDTVVPTTTASSDTAVAETISSTSLNATSLISTVTTALTSAASVSESVSVALNTTVSVSESSEAAASATLSSANATIPATTEAVASETVSFANTTTIATDTAAAELTTTEAIASETVSFANTTTVATETAAAEQTTTASLSSLLLSTTVVEAQNNTITQVVTSVETSTVVQENTITSVLENNSTVTLVETVSSVQEHTVTITNGVHPVTQTVVATVGQPYIIIVQQITLFIFTSALGTMCPVVQPNPAGGFIVGGDTYPQIGDACSAACYVQFSQCSALAGSNFLVVDCQTQLGACMNAAATQTVTADPVTITQTVFLPPGGATNAPAHITDGGNVVVSTMTLTDGEIATVGTGGVSIVTTTVEAGAATTTVLTSSAADAVATTPAVTHIETTSLVTVTVDVSGSHEVSIVTMTLTVPVEETAAASTVAAVATTEAVTVTHIETTSLVTLTVDPSGNPHVSVVTMTMTVPVEEATASSAADVSTSVMTVTLGDITGVITMTVTGPPAAVTEAATTTVADGQCPEAVTVTQFLVSSVGACESVVTQVVTQTVVAGNATMPPVLGAGNGTQTTATVVLSQTETVSEPTPVLHRRGRWMW